MANELSRRSFLKAGAGVGIGASAGGLRSAATTGASLTDIRHIVILIQENRSFDHYFGTYKGVRGFDDRSVGGARPFSQAYTSKAATGFSNPLLPFHIDTTVGPHQGECTNDIEHQWAGQHDAWHAGANDRWMESHLATEPTPRQAAMTMGYYTRNDLGFYHQLADNFTICDNYHCSVIAGTDINRLLSMTGTLDPDGWDGGLQFLDTKTVARQQPMSDLGVGRRWTPYPEVLQRAGISWKVYGTPDGQFGDNVLGYFPQYRLGTGDPTLAQAAFSSNLFPADFAADCQSGSLPQVSWLLAGLADTEHAPAPIEWGESITHAVISALVASPVWSSSALFVTYDENGGFFDHVVPPTPPPGTPGEFFNQRAMSALARSQATTKKGVDLSGGPVGLGYRVPMIVVSPFTRNPQPSGAPLVCSDTLDHTSILRFIETWSLAIGRPARIPSRDPSTRTPGLSSWRRAAVGDLTSAFNFAARPDSSVPSALLANVPNRADPRVLAECVTTGTQLSLTTQTAPLVPDPTIPAPAPLPAQEKFVGSVQRPSGLPGRSGVATPPPPSGPGGGSGARLPVTGGSPAVGAAGAAALGAFLAARWRMRRLGAGTDPE